LLPGLAYDSLRDRVILFGGLVPRVASGNRLDDTWAWDGVRWTPLNTGPRPPARSDTAFVYDRARDRIVMFGGNDGNQLRDTWEHDGTRWTQRTPNTVPTGSSPVMVFDSSRQVAVLVTHAGVQGAPVYTWEWDGIDWSLRANSGPTTSSAEGFAFDVLRGRCTLVGGYPDASEVWEWDGTAWTLGATLTNPARAYPIVVDDPAGGVTVIGGRELFSTGLSVGLGTDRSDRWNWDGTAMTPVHGDLQPPSRFDGTWVSDLFRGTGVLFGGSRGLTAFDDTWTWDGNSWRLESPTTRPPNRALPAVGTDFVSTRVLVFGGFSLGTFFNDFWSWNGSDWTQITSAGASPSPRSGAAMTFDPQTGGMLLFGGATGPLFQSGALDNQTWSWNGTSWVRLQTANAPSGRERAAMTFDLRLGRTYLFGGRVGATLQDQLNDFWEWDGVTWRQVTTPTVPPALFYPSLNFDQFRRRTLLTGLDPTTQEFQVWIFNGFDWRLLDSQVDNDLGGPAIFHSNTLRLVTYNGEIVGEWTDTLALVDDVGTGCGTPVPRLAVLTRARIGEQGFGLEATVRPGELVLMVLGDAQQSLPLPGGCTQVVGGAIATTLVIADRAGIAQQPIPLPLSPALIGAVGFAQAAALDPTAPWRLRVSPGLRLQVGG